MSADENQFIKKGQEMVHSFADDDHSKSYISANKADRASVFSGVQTTAKDNDPVIIDWNQNTANNESYMNQKQHRAQASLADAKDFLSQHVSQLDAVSEVDSQVAATPMMNIGGKRQDFHAMTQQKFGEPSDMKPQTPRDAGKGTKNMMEPGNMMAKQHSQNMTVFASKTKAADLFSPMKMETGEVDGNKSVGNLRKRE